ncbi:MAG: type II toxin-antitoxin system RelE/ParE family toxin [Bacteroidales bacterium]|nr:type II toxin-antitoxin system RelE/ParE family toxin [Bacteroidales bacterium]
MYRLIVKPFAEEDAAKAAVWYNDKSEGLGNGFLRALDAKINEIQRNPNHFQVVYKNIRRALTSRFPYGIFFIVESDAIYILAILHTSRNPKIWKDRE